MLRILLTLSLLFYFVLAPAQEVKKVEDLILTMDPDNNRWGYANTVSNKSKMKLPAKIALTAAFGGIGLGASLIFSKKEIVDIDWAIPPQYDKAPKKFSENVAAVLLNNKIGFIDRQNRFIINPQFEKTDKLSEFNCGLAAVKQGEKFGFIDKSGKMRIPATFEWAESFKDNMLASVKMDGKFGAIDIAGQLVVPCKYKLEEAMITAPISNKEYRKAVKDVQNKKENGLYDEWLSQLDSVNRAMNKLINDPDYIQPLPDYTLETKYQGDSCGLVRSDDMAWILEPTYTQIDELESGFYLLGTANEKWGIADSYGRIVVSCQYNSIDYDSDVQMFIVEEDSLYGIYNKNGILLAPTCFDLIGKYENQKVEVWLGLESGFVDLEGNCEEEFLHRVFNEAEEMEKISDRKGARDLYNRIILIDPGYAMAYHNLGIMDINIEEYKSGMAKLKIAHELDPDNGIIAENLIQAKKDRKERRWNRVMQGLEVAATVVDVAATTYNTVETVKGGNGSAVVSSASGFSGSMDYSVGESTQKVGNAAMYQNHYNKFEDNVKSFINSYQSSSSSSIVAGGGALSNIRQAQRNMREWRSQARKNGVIIQKSPWEDANPGPNKFLYEKKK